MKFLVVLLSAAYVSAAAVQPRHHKGRGGNKNKATAVDTTAVATATTAAATAAGTAAAGTNAGAAAAASGSTVVLKEVNGIPGNECLTFRNNGEIVDAACVNTAADRQLTPATVSGGSALKVQRTFTAGFRPDLVNVDACVGFNGTHFRASDCADSSVELVTFNQNGELVASGGACASGHDNLAQMTVDTQGQSCATYTSTDVTPTTS
ncbi:hypothetical protein TruAng_005045 [Truncatella angustata]|nr:hypothetical protein TruAng_005045 [Truncatella angustata]